jgi:hypothetical protein
VGREGDKEEEEKEEGDKEIEDEETKDEVIADNVDEAIEEMETDNRNITPNAIVQPKALSSIQKACLEFCIALLSQSITRKEYNSLLVCTLAVLGVKQDG